MTLSPPFESQPARTTGEIVTLLVATILLCALGYSVSPVLSPFVLLASLIFLLYPLRHDLLPGRMIWLAVFLFSLWFLYELLAVLAPFAIAFLIAYILNPFATRLSQKGLSRWLSALFVVFLFLAIATLVFVFAVPFAVEQFQSIIVGISQIANDLTVMAESGALFEGAARFGIPVENLRAFISKDILPKLQGSLTALFEGVFGVVTSISSLAMHVINLVIIPFLVFYLLMDFPVVIGRFASLVPVRKRAGIIAMAEKADAVLGRYFRGAIIVALIQGTLSAVALGLMGVQYALILGIMTALLNFIPYVGLLTSLVVSSIVALFSGDPVTAKVVGVVVLYISQKILEATVLGPKIIGTQVGLHPVLLILCLLVFGHFLGFIGLLIAVPASALILAAFRDWEEKREATHAIAGGEQ